MALTVKNLYETTSTLYRLHLAGGADGLETPVSWVYYTEDPSTIDFIRGGEIAITTGMNISREKINSGDTKKDFATSYFKLLIEKLVENHAAALIVNIGHYINSLPKKTIDLCNKIGFPIFTAPWEIHMVDIMQDYGNRIVREDQKNRSVEANFKAAMLKSENFDPVFFENTVFAKKENFSIVLLKFGKALFQKTEEEQDRYLNFSLKGKIPKTDFAAFCHNNFYVFIVLENESKNVGENFAMRLRKIQETEKLIHDCKISVSDITENIFDLKKEFRHAKDSMEFLNKDVSLYNNLGFYKILFEVQDKKVLIDFHDKILGKLNKLNTEKRNDFIKTLKLFLETNGKIQKTANKNFTHRNTILYRIKKIEETLGVDLANADDRFSILAALKIEEML